MTRSPSRACGPCACDAAARPADAGRLLLATAVDHTATALRTAARRHGTPLRQLAPGLLEHPGDGRDAFLLAAREALSPVEAEEVRCAVLAQDLPRGELLHAALRAPSLAQLGARVQHADLLPLFDQERARFRSVYQPIVDLRSGEVVAHEALLRATAPDGTPVPPSTLFQAAEAAGWTHVLDRVGRTSALRHAGPWLRPDEQLFINFVPTSIYRPEICLRTTEQAAADAGLSMDQLVFEVTETHQVPDVGHLLEVFEYYRSRGCRVALDDLGAGWSSLTMLVRLRPDVVKLDKELVQGLPGEVSASVVRAVVDIVGGYGGIVLAECVETLEQSDAARDLGVTLAQGWFHGRPVARDALPAQPVLVRDPALPDPDVRLDPTAS